MTDQSILLTGSFSCTCGASWRFGRLTPESAEGLAEVWKTEHSGPGHEPCSRSDAAKARREARRKAEAKGKKP